MVENVLNGEIRQGNSTSSSYSVLSGWKTPIPMISPLRQIATTRPIVLIDRLS